MGPLELFLIYELDGVWEEEWRPLQGSSVCSLLTVVSQEVMDHCLYGWSSPLFKTLGLPPWGALKKLPEEATRCYQRKNCVFFDKKTCFPVAKRLPWCYEPEISEDEKVRQLGNDIIKLWREGVYVIIVQEVTDAG
jgi:hypothetical protein